MPSVLKLLEHENYHLKPDIERVLGDGALKGYFDQALRDEVFRRSTNRKISPVSRYRLDEGKRADVDLVGAAIGFASGPDNSCPGATDFCSSGCYSINAEQSKASIGKRMKENFASWQEASLEEKTATIVVQLLNYNEHCIRRGVAQRDRIFRFNWAGDIADQETAQAIADAMRAVSRLTKDEQSDFALSATVYTRTYTEEVNALPTLIDTPNLNVYISIDPDNYQRAVQMYDEYGDKISLSFLGIDFDMGINLARVFAGLIKRPFDIDNFPTPELDDSGSMRYNYPDIIICPEEFPYGRISPRDGSRKYLDLNEPIRDQHLAELQAAEDEDREYDPYNVQLKGACAVCQACYGPNPKHVIFSAEKTLRSIKKNHPSLLSDANGVPVTMRKRRGGANRADAKAQVEQPEETRGPAERLF